MVTDDLIIYIEKQLGKNISKDLIISRLTQIGWRREDVEDGFAQIDLEKNPPSDRISQDVPFIEQLNDSTVVPHVDTVNIEDKKSEITDGALMDNLQQEVLKKIEELKKEQAQKIEALKIEALKQEEILKQEAVKKETLKQEEILNQEATVKQEALKKETLEKIEALKKDEALKQEIIKQETLKKAEALKEEVAREEEAQKEQETKRLEALKQEEILKQEALGKIEDLKQEALKKDEDLKQQELLNQESLKKIEDLKQEALTKEAAQKQEEIKQYTQRQEELTKQKALNQATLQKAEVVKQDLPKIAEPVKVWTPMRVQPMAKPDDIKTQIQKEENESLPTLIEKKPQNPAPIQPAQVDVSVPKEKISQNFDYANEFNRAATIKESVISVLPRQAMISTYSEDLLSASKIEEEPQVKSKHGFVKALIIILIIGFIGGVTFAFVGGYIKMPNLKLGVSLLGQSNKTMLAKVPDVFSSVKSYKVESSLKVTLLPVDNGTSGDITSSLVTGQDVTNSLGSEILSVNTKGMINKGDNYQSDFVSTIKSPTLKNSVDVDIKKIGENSFLSVSDYSSFFGFDVPNVGILSLSKSTVDVLYSDFNGGIGSQVKNEELHKGFLGGLFENHDDQINTVFKTLIQNSKISKNKDETINGVDTSEYSISIDIQTSPQLLNQISTIFLQSVPSDQKSLVDSLVKNISISSLNVWIGKNDNNIHQYEIVFKIPQVDNNGNVEALNSSLVFDLKYSFYDFNIVNDIKMPENVTPDGTFINVIKDSKLKSELSLFKTQAQELFTAQKNYGNVTNTKGSCDAALSGSLFSPLGQATDASAITGEISNTLSSINLSANNAGVCNSNSKAWAISVPLFSTLGQYYCVDSKSETGIVTTNQLAGTVCK